MDPDTERRQARRRFGLGVTSAGPWRGLLVVSAAGIIASVAFLGVSRATRTAPRPEHSSAKNAAPRFLIACVQTTGPQVNIGDLNVRRRFCRKGHIYRIPLSVGSAGPRGPKGPTGAVGPTGQTGPA